MEFEWDKKGEEGRSVLEIELGDTKNPGKVLRWDINGRGAILATTHKKRYVTTFPTSLLLQGKNRFRLSSEKGWTLRRLRIKNVYGYSKGLLDIVAALKGNRYGDIRSIRNSPFAAGWAVIFFILSLAGLGLPGLGRWAVTRPNKWLEPFRWLILVLMAMPFPLYLFSDSRIFFSSQTVFLLLLAAAVISWGPVLPWPLFRRKIKEIFARTCKLTIRYQTRTLTALLLVLASSLYLATILPGMGGHGDTAKFQFIGKILGIPHSPGYPLYVMLNNLFIRIPVRSIAFRANLMSVVFAVAALFLFFHLAGRISKDGAAAFYAALFLACSRAFWSQAIVAEVYTLNAFFVALVLFFLIKWAEAKNVTWLYLFFFFYALSFGNHLTMVTLFPAFLAYILMVEAKVLWKPKTMGVALGSALVGIGQYAFLLIRARQGAPYIEQDVSNLRALFDVITAKRFQARMFPFSFGEILTDRIPLLFRTLADQASPILLLAAMGGLVVLFLKNKKTFWLLFLSLIGQSFYVLNFNIPDLAGFLIPILLLTAVMAGAGFAWLLKAMRKKAVLRWAPHILLIVLVIHQAAAGFPKVDLSGERQDDEMLTALFEHIPPYSLIITGGYDYNTTQYLLYKVLAEYPEKHALLVAHYPETDLLEEIDHQVYSKIKKDENIREHFFPAQTSLPPDLPQFKRFKEDEHVRKTLFSNVFILLNNPIEELSGLDCRLEDVVYPSPRTGRKFRFSKAHF